MNTELSVENTDYRDNANKTKINYKDKNKTNYRDFEDINLKISWNDTLLTLPYSAENLVSKDTSIIIIEFDIMQFSLPTVLTTMKPRVFIKCG